MAISYSLPNSYAGAKSIIERALHESAASVLPITSMRKRPAPPRNLVAQQGSLTSLITWNAPANSSDIAGWKVYADNERNLIATIMDPTTRKYTLGLPGNSKTYVYVSAINGAGRESQKVGVLASSNTDQLVVSGTTGGTGGSTPSSPPGYPSEPSGGGGGGGGKVAIL